MTLKRSRVILFACSLPERKEERQCKMGWYHHQLMEGKTPEEVEKDMQCTDGSCAATPPPPPCHDCSCYETAEREDEAHEELYDATTGPICHLCQSFFGWKQFPPNKPTFHQRFGRMDASLARGSCVLASLVGTANTYYKDIGGNWIVLEIDPVLVGQMGTSDSRP